MTAVKIILFGILFCALGAGIIGLEQVMQLPVSATRPAAFFFLVIGGLFFVIGQTGLAAALRPPQGMHREDSAMAAIGLIRSMLAIIIADGTVSDEEVRMTAKLYKQLTGSAISEAVIRETAEDMIVEKVAIAEEMVRLRSILDSDTKQKIIKAALFILAADGKMAVAEEEILEDVRMGLAMPKGQFKRIKSAFLKSKGLAA